MIEFTRYWVLAMRLGKEQLGDATRRVFLFCAGTKEDEDG